tara:strand:- start:5 stop:835 length:831 start_codon:yes stop_codon:yes gene_type:complete
MNLNPTLLIFSILDNDYPNHKECKNEFDMTAQYYGWIKQIKKKVESISGDALFADQIIDALNKKIKYSPNMKKLPFDYDWYGERFPEVEHVENFLVNAGFEEIEFQKNFIIAKISEKRFSNIGYYVGYYSLFFLTNTPLKHPYEVQFDELNQILNFQFRYYQRVTEKDDLGLQYSTGALTDYGWSSLDSIILRRNALRRKFLAEGVDPEPTLNFIKNLPSVNSNAVLKDIEWVKHHSGNFYALNDILISEGNRCFQNKYVGKILNALSVNITPRKS